MKKYLFFLIMFMLPLVASAIVVPNADGVKIFYTYTNDGTELEVSRSSNGYTNNVVIPEEVTYENKTFRVTSIGYEAFVRCTGLTSVTIPSSVISIDKYAFYGCTGLTSLSIPSSVTSIGGCAFVSCTGLTSITVAGGNPTYDSRNNCNAIIESESNTLILGCKETTIPLSVTSIGYDAFEYCTEMTYVTIPSSVISIGSHAFSYCTGLTSVTISEGVHSVGIGAFQDCTGLTSLSIPSSVTSIDQAAFAGCSGLTSVTIPSSIGVLMNNVFARCTGLTTVTIPSSVYAIRKRAFYGCTGLTSLTIPSSVTSIGSQAFYDCDNLKTVVSLIQEPTPLTAGFSESTYNTATLYVPTGTAEKYKATEGWKNFYHIVEVDTDAVQNVKATPQSNTYYTIDGKRTAAPSKGINIVQGSKGETKKVLVK